MGYINKKLGRENNPDKPKGPSWMSTALGGLKKYRESKKSKAALITKEDEETQKEGEDPPKESTDPPSADAVKEDV